MIVCFVSSLSSQPRKSEGGALLWTNPHSLRSCPFPADSFDFFPVNLLLLQSHQEEITILKALFKDATTDEGGS